jgi:hypothetical protein
MPEQKAQKAFGLSDARAMLGKLDWELNNLFCRTRHDVLVCMYISFNCAVTAWHVTDWLYEDIQANPKLKACWKDVFAFQAYAREECPELKLCYQVATGSKHCLMGNSNSDPNVSATISDGEGTDYANPIIMDGDTRHFADNVFRAAMLWFQTFIQAQNIYPDEQFIPGDSD